MYIYVTKLLVFGQLFVKLFTLCPGHIFFDGTQLSASPPERGTAAPTFWPMSIVAKLLDG